MSEHTTGPWSVDGLAIVDRDGIIICWMGEPAHPYSGDTAEVCDNAEANAQLIAAAPDLYVACEAALGAFENNNAIDWNILSEALTKARGER